MRILALTLPLPLAALAGCAGPEEVGPPSIVSFTVDPTTVVAGAEVVATIEVENFVFSGGDHHHEEGEEGSIDHEGEDHGDGGGHDGEAQRGHVHIYLDDLITNPLIMMVEPEGSFAIPVDTEPGSHVLIARLQDEDHKIIEPQVTAEADIEVLAPDL